MRDHASLNRLVRCTLTASLCLLFLVMAVVAYGYSLSDELGPGPGFFPFWLGALGCVLAVTLLVQAWRGRLVLEGEETTWPDRIGALRTILLLVGTAIAALLLEPLGFRLTGFAFTAAMLVVLGVRRPLIILAFGLVSGFGLFHVFYYWLKVPLPVGALGL